MKQFRRFLKCLDDVVISMGTWSTVLANQDLPGNVETGISFPCSKHETSELRILRRGNKTKSRVMVLNFRRKLCSDTHWEESSSLKRRGVLVSWQIFKNYLLQARETSIPVYWNLGIDSSWLAWLRKMIFIKIKHKKGDVETRAGRNMEALQVCKERARRTKIHLKLKIKSFIKSLLFIRHNHSALKRHI